MTTENSPAKWYLIYENRFSFHVASTLIMVGIMYFVQFVHYPLFREVGANSFVQYQQKNIRSAFFCCAIFMLTEMITGIMLCWLPLPGLLSIQTSAGLILLVLIWLSSFLQQLPVHKSLSKGFDERQLRFLLESNWIRTIAWTIRAGIVLWMITSLIS